MFTLTCNRWNRKNERISENKENDRTKKHKTDYVERPNVIHKGFQNRLLNTKWETKTDDEDEDDNRLILSGMWRDFKTENKLRTWEG